MNAMNYVNVTARLAYYDAMKATAPAPRAGHCTARSETTTLAEKLRKLLKKTPKRRVVLVPAEDLHA
jgi:hypothetical protein